MSLKDYPQLSEQTHSEKNVSIDVVVVNNIHTHTQYMRSVTLVGFSFFGSQKRIYWILSILQQNKRCELKRDSKFNMQTFHSKCEGEKTPSRKEEISNKIKWKEAKFWSKSIRIYQLIPFDAVYMDMWIWKYVRKAKTISYCRGAGALFPCEKETNSSQFVHSVS